MRASDRAVDFVRMIGTWRTSSAMPYERCDVPVGVWPGRVKVAGPPRRTALWARADSGRAAGHSNRRYRPCFTVGDGLPGGRLAAACSIGPWFSIGR
jgi:hypothetical protein